MLQFDNELEALINDLDLDFWGAEKEDAERIDPKVNEVVKSYKNGDLQVLEKKPFCDAFEDEMWLLFYNMGFKVMNFTSKFKMSYSKDNPDLTQQIDVIAIDDDVCLFIECKATETLNNTKEWKNTLEAWQGKYPGLVTEIRTKCFDRTDRQQNHDSKSL